MGWLSVSILMFLAGFIGFMFGLALKPWVDRVLEDDDDGRSEIMRKWNEGKNDG